MAASKRSPDDLRAGTEQAERAALAAAALGWAPGSGGNLSLDLGDMRPPKGDPLLVELGAAVPGLAGRLLLVSRSGARFRTLRGELDLGLVRPLPDGDRAEAWFPGEAHPTFELDSHLALHAALRALVQRMPDGQLHVYYGVTEDGIDGPWRTFLEE